MKPVKNKRPASLYEARLKKKLVHRGRAVDFRDDTVRLPNGKTAGREFMDMHGAVGVLPVLPDGRIVLVRQYRYPVDEATWEIPAGKLHSRRDDREKRALAELREETGYTASGKLVKLADYWPTPAFSSELLTIYLARGLKAGRAEPDEDEFISARAFSFAEAWRMFRSGEIRDSKTVIALQAYMLMQRKNK